MSTQDIVAKLWRLCDVLRDDGITYHQYVTELTYLLFLKMAKETGRRSGCPRATGGTTWSKPTGSSSSTSTARCCCTWAPGLDKRVQAIYANASTALKVPKHLAKLVEDLDGLDWYEAKERGPGQPVRGAAREERGREEVGRGPVLHAPPADRQHGAAGEAAARRAGAGPGGGDVRVPDRGGSLHQGRDEQASKLSDRRSRTSRSTEAFYGIELVHDTHRLALMNLMLHGIEGRCAWATRCRTTARTCRRPTSS
jgi:type I restriction enzyme M protein